MQRYYDDPVTRDQHHHAYEAQREAHRLKVVLANAIAAGNISRQEHRTRYRTDDGMMTIYLWILLAIVFGLGGLAGVFMLRWMLLAPR